MNIYFSLNIFPFPGHLPADTYDFECTLMICSLCCMCMYVFLCGMCEGAYRDRGQHQFLSSILTFFFETGSLSEPGAPDSARLARQQTPGISLLPQLEHWGYRCLQPCPVLYKAAKSTFRYPSFPRKHSPIETLSLFFHELFQCGRQREWDNEGTIYSASFINDNVLKEKARIYVIRGK